MLERILTICVVIYLYLHVVYHLKTSNDLVIYDLDHVTRTSIDEMVKLRQPFTFRPDLGFNDFYQHKQYKVRTPALTLLSEAKPPFYSERNDLFLKEIAAAPQYEACDYVFRPPMCVSKEYDVVLGDEATGPFQYSIAYRTFLYCSAGSAVVKLAPPETSGRLNVQKDYLNMTYTADPGDVRTLETTLNEGDALFLPAYWWYSLTLKKASVCVFRYKTAMSVVATSPEYALHYLQCGNVKL